MDPPNKALAPIITISYEPPQKLAVRVYAWATNQMKNVLYAAVSLLFVACGGEDEASNEDVELKEEMYHEESAVQQINLISHRYIQRQN